MNEKLYDLTNPQKNIWNTEQYFSGTSINNVGSIALINEPINFNKLSKSISNVLATHDNFRLRLVQDGNSIKQVFDNTINYVPEIVDVHDLDEIYSIGNALCRKALSIENNKFFTVKIFRLPNNYGAVIAIMHHLIADSWCLGLFFKEFIGEYKNLIKNEENIGTAYSYIDFINDEQNYLNSNSFIKDKEYWSNIFSTVPETATIPSVSKNYSQATSCAANRQIFKIPNSLLASINEYCKKNKISAYNFLMAIYSIYIGRVSNSNDLVIGTPILNRLNFSSKRTNGMFVNTIPFRINIDTNSTFDEFSKIIAQNSMAMLRHQRYPYQNILEDLREKDSSIPNLYNVVLSYQITSTIDDEIKTDCSWIFNGNCADDLQIHVVDYNDTGLTILYDYKSDRYSDEEITCVHNRAIYMMKQVLNNSAILLSDIDIVTEAEKHKLLYEFNNTTVDYPKNKTIVDLFEEQVEKTPNSTAVIFGNEKLTYKELNEKANQLARYLLNNGVQKHDIVALRVDKSFEMIIGILAIIKAGCTYLPINMSYPQERVNYMLTDSSTKFLLTTSNILDSINSSIKKLEIDLGNSKIYSSNTSNLNEKISPEDLIYIIYTSGSTGKPKGAMLCHKNVVRLLKNSQPLYDFSENDVWTMFHSVAFDFSVWEMYGALLFGGKLVLVSDAVAKDTNLFLDLLRNEQVTVLNQTPTYFYNLLNTELDKPDNNLKLKYIIFGGEALNPKLIQKWSFKYPNTKLINMYGITETTVHVTYKELSKEDLKSNTSNIGKPIPTLQVLILDKNLHLLPIGIPGEMCILGDGVFKGYLNREDLNKQKLIPNSFYGKTLYRSGDLAILHNDGNLEYLGRIDKQVKLRGFRIELGEIEEHILRNNNIKSCIVLKKEDKNNRDILCAYYIKTGIVNIEDLKKSLQKDLPYYMIPQYFVELNKFPTNINGKIDVKALSIPDEIIHKKDIVAARNDIDSELIKAFSKFLGIKQISIEDSFFDLGGDSLSAISICSYVNKDINSNITVKNILEKPIIKDLSDFIGKSTFSNTSIPISKSKEMDYYPLSSAQKRIYYASKMISNNNLVYNTPGILLIDKLLDAKKVQNAFAQIIDSQSSFRTIFVLDGQEVKQKILDNVDFNIVVTNGKEKNINTIINEFSKPFDLEKAPLLRVEICYLDNKKTLLLIDSHHIIIDGVSSNLLIKDFFNIYNNIDVEKPKIEYKDYAVWENKFINTPQFKNSENYWLNRFKDFDFESLNLPYDYTIPANKTYIGKKLYSNIDKEIMSLVYDYARKLNMSPYVICLAALFVTLYKYTGQSDIVIGSPVANRSLPEVQNVIGMFVNNLAFRCKVLANQTVADLLNYLKNTVVEDLEHQDYPFDMLVKALHIPVDNSKNPLFDIVFTYQSQSTDKDLNIDYHQISEIHNNTAKFNITMELVPETNQLNIEYRSDLFKEETINSLREHYLFILKQMLESPATSIDNLDIITPEEQKLLNKFNNTSGPIKRVPVAKIFEEQAVLHANDIAVVCDDKTLTYKELNEKANSLANYLISRGIKPNDIVAVMTNRSLETIVCMIGILKSGAAFLNVDPTYPIERTEYYISDSKIEHVLTQRELEEKVSQIKNRIEIDLDNEEIYGKNTENPNVKSKERDLSYIIYTSGSTGTPKGVMLNQIGLSNMVQAMTKVLKYLKEGNKHAIASVTSTPFDIFVYEIIVSLTHGLKVVMANNAEHRNPKLLDALIRKHNVDVMTVTPSLMKINYDNREPNTALANVKNMVFGGEPLPEKFVKDLRALADDITIYNIYGPSEITILSNVQDLATEKEINVGPPILNTQMYILDKNMKQVPIGVIGEIYIAGIQVGEGYMGKKELTEQRFLKNPFGPGKIYKSGDIGRWTFEGKIQCLGRIDNQVKLRGLRIELGEIEDEILKMPGVSSAIVNKITLEDKESLCAYYVAEGDLSENTVKENLRKFLPQYMVPTYVVRLDVMPYTINRKIDRKALPLPELHKTSTRHVDINTLNSNEEKLLQIWKDILKVDDIDIDDNFFDIGGDSILAINMQIDALKYGLEFEYADIFNFPTIKQLAQKLPSPEEHFISTYDYSKINEILKRNTADNLSKIQKYNVGNILLIGGTGYLGAHILHSFLQNEDGIIYCLIRQKDGESPEARLHNYLKFYFGEDFIAAYKNRIRVVKGDITQQNIGLSDEDYKTVVSNINAVVNAGALVKHFGLKKQFEDINVTGTKNVVELCQKNNKRLIHISTVSVSGFGEKEEFSIDSKDLNSKTFTEHDLYIGQNIKGIYSITKYKAELAVLEAIDSGLDAQILRIGNITNRFSDGYFQKNINDNAFARRIKSFVEIGAFPKYLLDHAIEFTPVDLCADAIIKILQHNSPCTTFHIYDPNLLPIKVLYDTLTKRGIEMMPVSNEMMSYIITGILNDDSKKSMISGIIQDIDNKKQFAYISKIGLNADFTVQYLNKLGFNWAFFDSSYINKCFDYFEKINFINKTEENK